MDVELLGIAGLLLIKESGLPVPVPGDLVVLSAGIAAANGDIDPRVGLPVVVGATILGGLVQFVLLRGPARGPVLALLGRVGLSRDRIDRLGARLRRRQARGVAVARMTPGVRVVAIAAAALAAIRLGPFALGLAAGNAVFVGGHFALGFAIGRPALTVASSAGLVATAIVGLALIGALGWWLVRRGRPRSAEGATVAGWADAACPACLALAAIGIDRD
jgi:membrane protein DedA with SNARE-associated domain